jgi:hypothetical protein
VGGRQSRVVLFYATENLELRDKTLAPKRYAGLRRNLLELTRAAASFRFRFLPGAEEIAASRYLAHVHVDAHGYQMLAAALWLTIGQVILAE